LRLWRKQRMEDVQISIRDLVLAALYVADGVEYRRKLHCIFYWIKEEVEAALRNPFCGCKPAWRLEPAGAVLHKSAAVNVYKLRLTERGRDAARKTAANLPEELTREIKRVLRLRLCDLCGPIMKTYKDLLDLSLDDELTPTDSP